MGIISDTWEDTRELYGQYLMSIAPSIGASSALAAVPRVVTETCPLCQQEVFDAALLREHLFSRHRRLRHFLKINGIVVPETVFIVGGIESAWLHFWGAAETAVRLEVWAEGSADSSLDLVVADGRPADLLPHLREATRARVTVRYGEVHALTEIFVRSLPEISFGGIHDHFDAAQRRVAVGEFLSGKDWDTLRARMLAEATHPVAHRYVDGLWEYLWALAEDRTGTGGSDGRGAPFLERSFGVLAPFQTDLARLVVNSLALRFNWFWMLKSASHASRFHLIHRFFCSSFDDVAKDVRSQLRVDAGSQPTTTGLLIDDDDEHCIDAIGAFYARRWPEVEAHLAKMSTKGLRGIKRALLAARLARIQGDLTQAAAEYEMLLNDRDFGAEAQEVQ